MKSRWIRAAILAVLVAGGVWFYRATLRPDPRGLAGWAETALRDIFGPDAVHGEMTVDPLDGVRVRGLRVPYRGSKGPSAGEEPALSADEVVIRHDPLAMLSGVLRLESVLLRGPLVSAHETEDGEVALDFPFDPPRPEGPTTRPPRLVIENGTFRFRPSDASKKFRPGSTLVLSHVELQANPGREGQLSLHGSLRPEGVGVQPGGDITFGGQADLLHGTLDVTATWARLRLTEEVKSLLTPELLERLQTRQLEEGPHLLRVTVRRDPEVEAGRVRVEQEFVGTVRLDVGALPGGEAIDARTREQLNELFERIRLTVKISGNDVRVQDLAASLAGGTLYASGVIRDGGETVDVDLRVTGLQLDDPALKRLIGDDAFARFRATGTADATITLQREAGGPFKWEAAIDLIDATLVYMGVEDPVRKTPAGRPLRTGFPYEIRQCYGRVYVNGEGARFDSIKGRHGRARIRIRGSDEKSRNGGPTGFVRFGPGDTEIALTIEAQDIPFDADVAQAVEGSEFAGLLERFKPSGVVDRVLLDIVKRPVLDSAAVVELDLESTRTDFVFSEFQIPYDVAETSVTILQPVRPSGGRGKEFHIRGKGVAAGGEVTVTADLDAGALRGRVKVAGTGVRLDGELEKALLESEPGQGELGDVWRFLRPAGRVDVLADLPAYDDPGPPTYEVSLRGASVTLGEADDPDRSLLLEGLEGKVRVAEGRVVLEDVRGNVADAPVTIGGSLDGGTEGRWDVKVSAQGLRMSRGLLHVIEQSAAGGKVVPAGIELRPGGRMDLDLGLSREALVEPEHPPTLQASVRVANADLVARIGDLDMRVRGGFAVQGEEVLVENLLVDGRGIEIRIPSARVGPDGLRGGLTARLTDVRMGPEVLGLLPVDLRPTFASLTEARLLQATDLSAVVEDSGAMTLRGSLGLTAPPRSPPGGAPRGLVEFAPLSVSAPGPKGEREIRGRILMKGLDLDVGTRIEEVAGSLEVDVLSLGDHASGKGTLVLDSARVAGLRLAGARLPLVLEDDVLTVAPIGAAVYGGRFEGRVVVHTADPVSLEGRVAIRDLSLAELVAELGDGGTVTGLASLDIEFQSRGPALKDLTAAGHASVRDGDLGELPAFATIPALFSSFGPESGKPRFTSARAEFVLREETLEATCIALAGPLFCMTGHGTLDLSGRVDLTFAPQILKSFFLPGYRDIPGVGDVLGLLREDPLYVVRVRGPIDDPSTAVEPFPFVAPGRRSRPEWEPTPFEGRLERRVPRQFH